MTASEALQALAVAVGAGLLIGAERQRAHEERPGSDFGGIRTFPLFAIAGVMGALLGRALGTWITGALLGAVAVALGVAQARAKSEDVGVSTEIAAIITFSLGVLAATPELMPDSPRFLLVAGIAATTMALLALKRPLHGFIARVSSEDVYATVKFVVLAVVVIPLLPNRTYGPLDVLNPRKIGLVVTLVAGVGFAGYVAARVVGSRRGLLVAGLIGGLVSSTALTLALSTRVKEQPALARVASVGIMAGCATMFPRMLVVVAAVNFPLVSELWPSLLAMGAAGYVWAFFVYARSAHDTAHEDVPFRNPFELNVAVKFGLIYGGVLFVVKAAQEYVGTRGLYASAALAGIADVDAITLSLAELARSHAVSVSVAPAIALAAFVNTLVKAGMATLVGGRELGKYVAPALVSMLLSGAAALLLGAALSG